ncbi:extracellular catalytic domain type 1 short-chain-length polyhydroxyalkanoate depolymerase [Isoptericola croceus]|uniref:extracellular catalytic domain type 1 short-chain-length polyhydroxyalkanoate depolymerase n=1 Tax=Isoptericola croceus TaxID=3031406 RepID=UPI0023F7990F|nr:PHB depolymerase family esterase [Isoptericola croceus]
MTTDTAPSARTRPRLRRAGAALAALVLPLGVAAPPAAAATLAPVEDFGANPSGLNMYAYVPDAVADGAVSDPALLVGVHWCSGSAQAYYDGTAEWRQAADEHGFVIVYPENERADGCFDVASPEAMQRGGASDPTGIMSMVNHAVDAYGIDTERIYVTGISSGAMMTNLLAAQYPDVFAAGAAFAGVPATCFATGSSTHLWSTQCAQGELDLTGEQWAQRVRDMNPGYAGAYPRMQLWHGAEDDVLSYANLGEAVEQWTTLHGIDESTAQTDTPEDGWVRTRYGADDEPPVETIVLPGVGHNVVSWGMAPYAIDFLGLDDPGAGPDPDPGPTPDPEPTDPGSGDCSAVLVVQQSWTGGFTAAVTVTATTRLDAWRTVVELPDGTAVVTLWNGDVVGEDPLVVTNAAWNGGVAAGGTVSYGFNGAGTAPVSPQPVECG